MCDAMTAMMAEVRRATIPTAEENVALAEHGEVDELVRRNMPMVIRIATRYAKTADQRMDLIQVGSIGLWRAAELFDLSRGVQFQTYAYTAIENAIRKAIKRRKRDSILDDAEEWTVLMDRPKYDVDSEVEVAAMAREEGIESEAEMAAVQSAVGELSPVDQIIICRRYSLDGDEPSTLDQLGGRLGITRERVRQRQCKALERLRERLV